MAEIRSRVTADGALTYLEAGPAHAMPVVFLHGIGGSARLWTRQLASFGEHHRAVAWNMPGYGGSAPLPTSSVGLLGDALARFLELPGLDRPVLVGHSLGGMVVQSYLADGHPPPRGAVLAQTSPAFGGRDPAWARDFVAARLEPLERGETMRAMAPAMVEGMIGEGADPDGVALALDAIAETPESAYRDSTLAMIGFDRREALERIAVPTLVVSGSADRNAPAATMEKMAARIPGAEYVCVEGCGHLVMAERPDAFDGALRAFLARLEPAGADG